MKTEKDKTLISDKRPKILQALGVLKLEKKPTQ